MYICLETEILRRKRMERKDNYSNELERLLLFMEQTLAKELPTPILTSDYFVLAVLNQRDSFAYNRLYENLTTNTIDSMHDSYYRYLSQRALSAIKPGREIRYDTHFTHYLEEADKEREKLNAEKVTSEHVLLAILKDTDNNKIANVFKKAGITYDMLYRKVSEDKTKKKDIAPEDVVVNEMKNIPDDFLARKDIEEKMMKQQKPNSPTIVTVTGEGDPSEILRQMFGGQNNENGMPPFMQQMNKKKGGKDQNIQTYCTNLNELAENGNIDPLVGRDRETQEIIRVLGRRRKNNVILIGGEGVGKTAIGEDIAFKIVNGEVPPFLMNKKVISLDMTSLIAGTTLRGMFEERIKGILDEIKADGNYILFIDNIGDVLADKGKGDFDISSMLSHALESGEVQVIGTADFKSFRNTFDKDPSLSRRFQKVVVEAPNLDESKDILFGLKPYYEEFHDVKFTDDAVNACVELANRYITERNLPDSAIDVLDEAGSFISTSFNDTPEIRDMKKNIRDLKKESKRLRKEDNIVESDRKLDESKHISIELNEKLKELKKIREENTPTIDKDTILHIISMKTGIPVDNLSADDKKKLATMDVRLKEEVIGQDAAIDTIVKALKRNRIGLHSGKCLYSGIMIGRSGVGKTLIAKKLAKEMFGDEKALVRFDMSEYTDKSAVSKLIGSNPGYVGYDEGGQLTEIIKNKKHCVLLLDEIEKADPEIYNIFLQVLDEGFLTDNSGLKVDFKNVIVLFTSNVGAKAASDFGKGIGFNEDINENSKRILTKQLRQKFPPEFLNRLDNILYFNNLDDNDFKKIIEIEANELVAKVRELGYDLTYDSKVVDFILDEVKDQSEYGARPIKRAIQDEIEDKITDILLEKDYGKGKVFNVTVDDDGKIYVHS